MFFGRQDFRADVHRFTWLTVCLALVLAVLVSLVVIPAEPLLCRWLSPVGIIAWFLFVAPTAAWAFGGPTVSLADALPVDFVAAFILHAMLPFKPPLALALSLVSSAGLIVASAILANWETQYFWCQVRRASSNFHKHSAPPTGGVVR